MNYLKSKAKDNYNIAKISEKSNCFDVAVSRYYYYLYQNVMNYLFLRGETIERKEENKHIKTIGKFIEIIKNEGNYEKQRSINKLWRLKDRRHDSDYKKEKKIKDDTEFNKIFKRDFNDVENAFNSLNVI